MDNIQDADIVESQTNDTQIEEVDTKSDKNAATILLDLEAMIKSHITGIDNRKSELRKHRDMLASVLLNDATYKDHEGKAKEALKIKNATKKELLKQPANQQIASKVHELSLEVREMNDALADYLREYQRMSGATEIETDDGEIREIINTPKLVKKSNR